jgi:hypothetical protein
MTDHEKRIAALERSRAGKPGDPELEAFIRNAREQVPAEFRECFDTAVICLPASRDHKPVRDLVTTLARFGSEDWSL